LTTLNDPVFFEAAQHLALRMTRLASADIGDRAAHGFRLALSRTPSTSELEHLVSFHREERTRFEGDLMAAFEATAGIWDGSANPDLADLAAWTMVANVLLNLDETITKE